MALSQIVIATDLVQDMVTKVNANANATVIGATTASNLFQLTMGNGALVTVANALPFRKGAGTSSIQANDATNTASGTGSFAGGLNNTASGAGSSVVGGSINTASFQYAFIGGGLGNTASQNASAVVGGIGNQATGGGSFVGGGATNHATGLYSMVLGGLNNTCGNNLSSVIAGSGITTSENFTAYASNLALWDGGVLKFYNASNNAVGSATLVGGTVTISNSLVQTGDLIFLTNIGAGGTVGVPAISAIVAGTSFTITSSSALDTSTIAYMIVRKY